jgi:hypothetical protein
MYLRKTLSKILRYLLPIYFLEVLVSSDSLSNIFGLISPLTNAKSLIIQAIEGN